MATVCEAEPSAVATAVSALPALEFEAKNDHFVAVTFTQKDKKWSCCNV